MTTTRRLPLLVLVLALVASPACVFIRRDVGRPFPDDQQLETRLQLNLTTKAEALGWLGAPVSVRQQFDGDLLIWHRSFEHSESIVIIPLITFYLDTEGAALNDRLALLFDHDGVLTGIGLEREVPVER
ncbi:MAG: hypothetical protein DRQ55_06640 [Planctomycetota bacterium]|nr:MAG: hypothetical protein DRQ55_06640 [Planctomycetota bacterium]